jgi:hypothetical protein
MHEEMFKKICLKCGKLISYSNFLRHECKCIGKSRILGKIEFTGKCRYCEKIAKNGNSQFNHERYCKNNPNREINFFCSEDAKERRKKGKRNNQYTKAKELGLPKPSRTDAQRSSFIEMKKKPISVETRRKLSLARSKTIEELGGNHGGFQKIGSYKIKNLENEEFWCRGLWERDVANWLNSQGIHWIRKIYLPYTLEGKPKTYVPDFYLPDKNKYIEVKGYYKEYDKRKMEIIKKQYSIEIIFIFEEQIKEIRNGTFVVDALLT